VALFLIASKMTKKAGVWKNFVGINCPAKEKISITP
jgi:hypothetical protein